MSATIEILSEDGPHRLTLLPERAVFWENGETLLVADAHFGKAAAFRAGSVPIPRGTTATDLARLSAVIERTAARRLVFLGDLLHAKQGRAPETLIRIAGWRRIHAELEVILVRGNHDERAGDPPSEWEFTCVADPFETPPFVLRHTPVPHPAGYVLSGHLHPCVRLSGPGRQHASLPCFFFSESVAILPAFGDFTGTARILPSPDDRVFVIADGEVMEVSRGRVAVN